MSFAAALVVGFAVGNTTTTILWRAIGIMVLGWLVGLAIGAIAQRTVDDHVRTYKEQHPIPGAAPENDDQGTDMAGEPA